MVGAMLGGEVAGLAGGEEEVRMTIGRVAVLVWWIVTVVVCGIGELGAWIGEPVLIP